MQRIRDTQNIPIRSRCVQVGLGLPNPKIDPSGPIEKVWKHLPRPWTKDSAIVADRTNQANEKDITSTLIP